MVTSSRALALAVRDCSMARRFKDFSTAMFFLLAGVVAQLNGVLHLE